MTMAITIERYIAVYHPLDYNRIMTDATTHRYADSLRDQLILARDLTKSSPVMARWRKQNFDFENHSF